MTPTVELWWLPLGAGGSPVVRWSGRAYEHLHAWRQHRPTADLYHAALRVGTGGGAFVVEVAPVWSGPRADRGVVGEGPVGSALLERWRLFRYEIRCWQDGVIPDAEYAVASPVLLPTDPARADRLVRLTHQVPTPVWGRDELGTGDMWNSNSVVSWLLLSSGHPLVPTPPGGRAPGWRAGAVVALREWSQRPVPLGRR